MNKNLAQELVITRNRLGRFRSREELGQVKGLGPRLFTQCAGFLRIAGGAHPLDNSWIHPESYEATGRLLSKLDFPLSHFPDPDKRSLLASRINEIELESTARELGPGSYTLKDLKNDLVRVWPIY